MSIISFRHPPFPVDADCPRLVNYEAPHLKNLLRLWDLQDGTRIEKLTGERPTVTGFPRHSVSPDSLGSSQYLTSANYLYYEDAYRTQITDKLTVFVDMSPVPGTLNTHFIDGQASTNNYNWLIGINNTNSKSRFIVHNGTAVVSAECATAESAGCRSIMVGTYDGENVNVYTTSQNASNAQTGTVRTFDGVTLFGRHNFGGTSGFYRIGGIANRVWNAEEIEQFLRDPARCFFVTHRVQILVPVTFSTGSHDLTAATTTQDATSGTGAVTTVHNLTAATTTQDATSGTGAVTLTGSHDLTAGTTTQDATSGVGYITQVLTNRLTLWDCDSLSGVVAGSHNAATLDASRKFEGSYGIQLSGDGVFATCTAYKDVGSFNPSTQLGVIAMYFDTSLIDQNVNNIGLSLKHGASAEVLVSKANAPTKYRRGPQWFVATMAEYGAFGSANTAATIRAKLSVAELNPGTYDPKVTCDAVLYNAPGRPTVVFTFDDAEATHLSVAAPALAAYGWKGTLFVPKNVIGTTNKLTWANVQTLYDTYGWDASVDSDDGNSLTGKGTLEAAIASVVATRTELNSRGMTRGNEFLCYPNGAWDTTPTLYVKTATCNGTTQVTLSNTTSLVSGMTATGLNVPSGTAIVSVDDSTHVTLTNAVSGSLSMGFRDTSSPFFRDRLIEALETAGFRTGRTTEPGSFYSRFGFGSAGMTVPAQSTSDSLDHDDLPGILAILKARVDDAIVKGTTAVFYIHKIMEGATSTHLHTSVFNDLIAYVREKELLGKLDVLRWSDWYARDNTNVALTAATTTQDATSGTGAITHDQYLLAATTTQDATSGTGAITHDQYLLAAVTMQSAFSGTGAIRIGEVWTMPPSGGVDPGLLRSPPATGRPSNLNSSTRPANLSQRRRRDH